jgi:hypothetical protein
VRDQFRCNSRQTRGVKTHMNHKTMMRVRIWAPFLIGFLGGSLAIRLEEPIGEFLGVYNPLLGYAAASMWSGALIALIAALASRTWRGLLTLLGVFGVPAYIAAMVVVAAARAVAAARGPRTPAGPIAGWPPVSSSIPSEAPEDGPPPS